ncbi:MAG TPA: DNA cytosine methyltransferase [Devosia sp.]|jgi:DNA (cytosine-5)-methyltransferase 1|uniref:DNA cytosine methyltransferase n=1 Tax=Devosia sp. TaxID=1871048 RepID=UPI002DDD4BCD|nr:DNA cytosine methyltransferase [Devosia sp.]HEV2517823.1 DNA cytosine methyltransferase [Devosia sp.]
MMTPPQPAILDLFCGCSGFGLGARQAGFAVPLSVDIDPILTSSHNRNFAGGELLLADIGKVSADAIADRVGVSIDGIIGGPPCQGFSSIGRSDPSDPRRELVGHFFRLVKDVGPRFFVMENVKGLVFSKNRHILDDALDGIRNRYKILDPIIVDAAQMGAATRRERVFVIGYDREYVDNIDVTDLDQLRTPATTVGDAIGDLANAEQVSTGDDLWAYADQDRPSDYALRMRSATGQFTLHRRTPHRNAIIERFAAVEPGSVDRIGRHPRLSWDGQCPTLRAGTGADKGSYQAVRPIHPSEPRVITVREAARLQGFPDSFQFHPTIWHSFRMIGNSVSPVVARSLLSLLASRMAEPSSAAA